MVGNVSLCVSNDTRERAVYIKWFLEVIGHEGLNNMLAAYPDKSAVCTAVCPTPSIPSDQNTVTA